MRVLNKRNGATAGVYIGRPSKWGNPFHIGKDGSRTDVIEKYAEYATHRFSRDEFLELSGEDLICWCAPLPCHGDVLVELVRRAEMERDQIHRICEKCGDEFFTEQEWRTLCAWCYWTEYGMEVEDA